LHYKIFAAYNYDDRHLLLANDNFTDPFVLDKFQQEILAQQSMTGFVDQNTVLNKDSHILTLSTCNAYDDQRYLVQCLLMNPEVLPKTDSAAQGGTSAEAQTGR
jgi:sortase B